MKETKNAIHEQWKDKWWGRFNEKMFKDIALFSLTTKNIAKKRANVSTNIQFIVSHRSRDSSAVARVHTASSINAAFSSTTLDIIPHRARFIARTCRPRCRTCYQPWACLRAFLYELYPRASSASASGSDERSTAPHRAGSADRPTDPARGPYIGVRVFVYDATVGDGWRRLTRR